MPALVTYTDFLKATKIAKFTSPTEILNEAVLNTYIIREMVKGKGPEEVIRTGQSIKDTIQLSQAGTFQFYSPNAEFNPTDDDILTDITVSWRFSVVNYGYTDETIRLNHGTTEDVYVDLKHKYEQGCRTDMWNGTEAALWNVPVSSTMETGTGDSPPFYSIPVFVNEGTNGLWPTWTTIEGVNPATESRWRCKQKTYDSTSVTDEQNGILAAFDDMFLQVEFESPETSAQYFEQDNLRQMKIFTNRDGQSKYKQILRGGNDRFLGSANPSDPNYNMPVYSGIPVKYIATLDTAALEIVSNAATGAAYPVGKPRYFFLNLKYLFPIYHSEAYMEMVGPIPGGITMPFSHAVYYRNWMNLFCRSRQRQGIVSPA